MGEPLIEPLTIVCEQCRLVSDEEARGWIALLTADVHGKEDEGIATFCPECARVEFGYRDEEQDGDAGRRDDGDKMNRLRYRRAGGGALKLNAGSVV